jgi:hypothetical protein
MKKQLFTVRWAANVIYLSEVKAESEEEAVELAMSNSLSYKKAEVKECEVIDACAHLSN